jgi:hypothetical protein
MLHSEVQLYLPYLTEYKVPPPFFFFFTNLAFDKMRGLIIRNRAKYFTSVKIYITNSSTEYSIFFVWVMLLFMAQHCVAVELCIKLVTEKSDPAFELESNCFSMN